MEPDEIGVVLARASELHAKISDAIERALKTEFLLSTGGRSPNAGDLENALYSPTSSPTRYGGQEVHGKSEKRYESDIYERGAVSGDGSAEARSLGAIRDALEVLEEQLESLQTVQQQQRTEKDAALAELEESRRILLRRLKEHRGREWEVVHEALAFAGEPVEDRDDLPLPPYPMPLLDSSSFPPATEDQPSSYHHGTVSHRHNGNVKELALGPGQGDSVEDINFNTEAEGSEEDNHEENQNPKVAERSSKDGGVFLGIPLGSLFGLTTKAVLVVVSVIGALAVSEVSHRLEKRRTRPTAPYQPPPTSLVRPRPPTRDCPPGKKLIMEDGIPKCIVKERVELPFPREIKTPDVLYGRG